MKLNVTTLKNEVVGEVSLDQEIFGLPLRKDILHRVVQWQLAKRRAGTHKTKGVSEVSGTTKKPYKQKGTGNARHGSLRSAQFRGGGVIFGPVVRSHEYSLNKKIRKLGLKIALSQKLQDGNLYICDEIKLDAPKTSELSKAISAYNFKSMLVVDGDSFDNNFELAAANIKHLDIIPQIGLNVYDILKHEKLIITKSALTMLEARLK